MNATLWRDRKWAITVAISLLGALVPAALVLMQRDTKTFTYELIAKATILDLSDPTLSQVKAQFQGRELTKLTVWTVALTNTGSAPIHRNDFDSPITLQILGEVSLLRFLVTESRPTGFRPKVTQSGNGINIEPALWNPGDTLTLQIVADGSSTRLEVTGRIAGIAQLESSVRSNDGDRRRAYIATVLVPFGVVGYGFLVMAASFALLRRRWVFGLIVMPSGLFMGAASAVMFRYADSYFRFNISNFRMLAMSGILIFAGSLLASRAVRAGVLPQVMQTDRESGS